MFGNVGKDARNKDKQGIDFLLHSSMVDETVKTLPQNLKAVCKKHKSLLVKVGASCARVKRSFDVVAALRC